MSKAQAEIYQLERLVSRFQDRVDNPKDYGIKTVFKVEAEDGTLKEEQHYQYRNNIRTLRYYQTQLKQLYNFISKNGGL